MPVALSNIVTEPDHLREVVERIRRTPQVIFDCETRPGMGVKIEEPPGTTAYNEAIKFYSLNPRLNEVYWLSLATLGVCVAIPMGHPNGEQVGTQPAPLRPGTKSTKRVVPKFAPPPPQMEPAQVFDICKPLFFDTDVRKVNHNVKFDALTISKYYGALIVPPYADTVVQAHLINENRPLDLGALTKELFKYQYEKLGKNLQAESFSRAATYSWLDAKYDWLIYRHNAGLITAEELDEYWGFECDVTEVLTEMEWVGVPVRQDEVADLDVWLREEMDRLQAELWSEAGREFSLSSPVDKGWFIFEHCEHEPWMQTPKKKEPSLAKEHLQSFTHDERVARLMEYESLAKLYSTYVLNFAKYSYKGRIHANFKQAGTVTGRFSCGEPNLQNVPKPDTEVGKRLREMFWAGKDDECLVVGDYSQIELRVLAYYSGDPTMCAAFEAGEDIHQASANTLGCDRSIAKNINFAIPFGAGYKKVAAMGGGKFSIRTAKKFYNKHREDFPTVWEFIEKTRRDCRRYKPHEVRTILGRKRRLPQIRFINSDDERLSGLGLKAERQAVNTRIQGSAADLIKMAMIRLHDMLDDDMHIILQVHDELVVTTPREKADRCLEIMREAMEGPEMQILLNPDGSIRVPVTANIKIVDRWSEAK